MDGVLFWFQSPETTIINKFPQRPFTSCPLVYGEYIWGSKFALGCFSFNICQYFEQHLALFLGFIYVRSLLMAFPIPF
jgi:hypothetical protein